MSKKVIAAPRVKLPKLDEYRKKIPEGGLLDPKLRNGFEEFDVRKLFRRIYKT